MKLLKEVLETIGDCKMCYNSRAKTKRKIIALAKKHGITERLDLQMLCVLTHNCMPDRVERINSEVHVIFKKAWY